MAEVTSLIDECTSATSAGTCNLTLPFVLPASFASFCSAFSGLGAAALASEEEFSLSCVLGVVLTNRWL